MPAGHFCATLPPPPGSWSHEADGALVPGASVARALDDPVAAADRLWRAYLRDRAWTGSTHALEAAGDAEAADTVRLREAIVGVVDTLPEGEWFHLDAVSEWLERTQPALVREQLTARGLLHFEASAWADLEAPLLRYVLLGPLYWLGRIATSVDGSMIARRGRSRRV